ncbi:MAG: YicC/YloC family endoribonuclease, partial [Flavobacteriales bacterium]
MTGFGKAEGIVGSKKLTVEVRALNSKQLDLSVRLPSIYREKEMDVRMYITEHVVRGKVDVLVYYETLEAEKRIALNRPIMEAYFKELKQFSDDMGMSQVDILNAIIRIPEVLKPENTELTDEEWQGVNAVLAQSVTQLESYRKVEGD